MKFFSGQKLKWNFIIPIFLWLLIWAGYNADYGKLHSSNLLNFFHGIRAFFPILAGVLAFILLIKRHFFSQKILKTPLGFLIIYTLIGIISSIFLSAKPLIALYWSFSYFSVLAVLFLTLIDSNSISSLINLNWVIIFIITIGLVGFFLSQSGVISSLISEGIFNGRPYEGLAGVKAEEDIFGMAGTRPTGLGRYAGLVAIFALARTILNKERKKFLWYFLFLIFFFLLYFSQAKTAIFGFIFGIFIIFLLKSKSKIEIFGWSLFTIFLLVLTCLFLFYPPILMKEIVTPQVSLIKPPSQAPPTEAPPTEAPPTEAPPTEAPPTEAPPTEAPPQVLPPLHFIFTLGGRTVGVWPQAWKLFLKSPLIGFGFHADRIFLEGQHAHNAILHALIQTGVIGTIPFIIAFVWAWIILFKLFKKPIPEKPFLIEIAAIFAFFTIRGITESTGAFFGVDWILLAPLLAYLQFLNQKNYGQKSNSINSNFRK